MNNLDLVMRNRRVFLDFPQHINMLKQQHWSKFDEFIAVN